MADDEDDDTLDTPTPEAVKPKRKRRASTGSATPKPLARVQRRADNSKQTIRELIRLRKPDLDVDGLSFAEVVDRDADAWGRFLAQLAEWFVPFGKLIDLLFGAPLLTLLGLAPSVRAARRDLAAHTAAKKAARAAAEQAAAEQEPFRGTPE